MPSGRKRVCAAFLCAGAAKYGTAGSTTSNQALPERTVDGRDPTRRPRLTVAEWLSGGVPEPGQKGIRPVSSVFEVNTVLSALRLIELTTADAQKIVSVLRDRQSIKTAVV